MGNRRENLKKSLGLTEYPWSSDDEDNPQIVSESTTTSRRQTDTANSNAPETSSSAPPAVPGPSLLEHSRRRIRGRVERDLYWSLLNTPTRPPIPGPSRSLEPNESIDLTNPIANLQRILAIKRLSRNHPNSSRHCIHPVQDFEPPQPLSAVNQTDNTTGDQDHNGRQVNVSGLDRTPQPVRHPLEYFTRVIQEATTQESRNASAPNSPENRNALAGNSPEGRNATAADASIGRAAMVANIPADRVSHTSEDRAEDVMEIDGTEDENQPDDNVSNQAQASGDDEENEENVDDAPAASPASPLTPQGTKRKREASEEMEVFTVQDLNRSLLQLLECPVCLEWMEPPMAQCRRGHLVCVRCRARLASCPVCRTAFSSVRNRAMEGVAEMLRYPCRHGCGRETRLRQRGAHEASCAARRYRCPAASCARREPLPLNELPHHFQTCHLSILKVGSRHQFSMRMNVDQHDDWLVMVGRDLFYMRVDVNIRTWGIVVHVAYIGPKCNANNYTYEVSVCGLHNERKLVYTRETHSDLESASLNVSRQDCFHLSLDQALNFLRYKNRHCEPDKFLDFAVQISKIDPPGQNPQEDLDS